MLLAQRKPASDTQFRDHTSHLRRRRRCASNEITDITAASGQPQWPTPSYNAVGNTTSFPQPNDPTSSYDATYDAWNRLVKLVDGGNTVAEYAYDGRNFRIVKRTYDAGVLDETRNFYYSADWQVLEERVEPTSTNSSSSSSSSATTGQFVDRQFVWGKRYIDDLVCRNRDTTGNGTLDERLWALQDANFNVTGVVALAGSALERYEYDAYGRPIMLNGNWTERATSSYDWNIRYAGYGYDAGCGMYQVRHRVLHPELGRWLQRDAAGYVDGQSLYLYASANPILRSDPLGLDPTIVGGMLIGCGVSGAISLVTGWLDDRSGCQCLCDGIGGCLWGALSGAILTKFPTLGGCMFGAASAISKRAIRPICDKICGAPTSENENCELLAFLASVIFGCVAGKASGHLPDKTHQAVFAIMVGLVGHDFVATCKAFSDAPANPEYVLTAEDCMKRYKDCGNTVATTEPMPPRCIVEYRSCMNGVKA